jgi:tRNA wybutosine-synthesizing protein 1
MNNVPYHDDVVAFGAALCDATARTDPGGGYGIACEHEHSCCILLARRERYFIGGGWHTFIDYERFQVDSASLHFVHAVWGSRERSCYRRE